MLARGPVEPTVESLNSALIGRADDDGPSGAAYIRTGASLPGLSGQSYQPRKRIERKERTTRSGIKKTWYKEEKVGKSIVLVFSPLSLMRRCLGW